MDVKIDENLPASLGEALTALGHNADTVPQQDLAGANDDAVWHAAHRTHREEPLDGWPTALAVGDSNRTYAPGCYHAIGHWPSQSMRMTESSPNS